MKHLVLIIAFFAVVTGSVGQKNPSPSRTSVDPATWSAILDHKYPRLVLFLSFDQLRWDYMTRFSNMYLPANREGGKVGGFRYLLESGATFADAHYSHVPTHTGTGHATMLTGAAPSETGIVGNDWLTSAGVPVNCVDSPDHFVVGAPRSARQRGVSPQYLLAPTVGDELLIAHNRRSKIVGIGIKDRGAVLPAGHNPTACAWFDSTSGNWITSTYYTTGTLPGFIEQANTKRLSERWVGKSWELLLPEDRYQISHGINEMTGQGDARNLGGGFPKVLGSKANKEYFDKMTFTPFAGDMLVELAKMAVDTERLGADEIPDILTLSFSNLDLAGHSWGPHSPECQDLMIRTDAQVSDLINSIAGRLANGTDDLLVVVTGDHGVSPLPDWVRASTRMPSERILYTNIASVATQALAARYSDKDTSGILSYKDPYVYFRLPSMLRQQIDSAEAQQVVARAIAAMPGIAHVFTRTQIENRQIFHTGIAEQIYAGYHAERCGDVVVIAHPFNYPSGSGNGTSHGSGYSYDTNVPVLFAGWHVKPGAHATRIDIKDIAPTISFALGIPAPAASSGKIRDEIFR